MDEFIDSGNNKLKIIRGKENSYSASVVIESPMSANRFYFENEDQILEFAKSIYSLSDYTPLFLTDYQKKDLLQLVEDYRNRLESQAKEFHKSIDKLIELKERLRANA